MTVTFNPSDCASIITLSNGDLTASSQASGGNGGVRANVSVSSGKFYFEAVFNATAQPNYDTIGVYDLTTDTAHMYQAVGGVGITSSGVVYINGGSGGGSYPNFQENLSGQTICTAVDLTNKLYWVRVGNGPWNASATADPASGTGGLDISGVINGVNAAPGVASSSAGVNAFQVTANFGASAYSCKPPSGFNNWDGSSPTGPSAPASVTWDQFNRATGITLSNGNLTAANNASGNNGAFAYTSATTGKYYFEATATASSQTPYDNIGVTALGQITPLMYTASGGVGICPANGQINVNNSNSGVSFGGSILNETISVAVDLTNKRAWFRVNGGNWNNSGTADPASNTGGIDISSVLGSVPAAPAMSSSDGSANGMVVNAVFASGSWAYSAPSGFSAWPVPSGSGGGGPPTGTITTALTKASISASAYTPPRGTFNTTENPDQADLFQGWAVRQPEPQISGWRNIWSDGNRLSTSYDSNGNGLITNVTVVLAGLSEFAPFYTAFKDGNGPYYTGTPTAGQTVFQWELVDLLCIDGLSFAGGSGSSVNFGVWEFDGSIDGETWFSLGQFNWIVGPNGFHDGASYGCTATFSNNIAWKYYRLICVTPAGWPGRDWSQLVFRIPGTSAIQESHAITTTASSTITANSDPVSYITDGLRNPDYPTSGNAGVYNNILDSGSYFQFDFGPTHEVILYQFRMCLDTAIDNGRDWGQWQWYGSHDGNTYTTVGATFHLYGDAREDAVFTVNNDGNYYRFWRLGYVSGTTNSSQIYGLSEIYFDMSSVKASALNAVESADSMSARGYPGAFGEVGDFTPTENADIANFVGNVTAVGSMLSTEAPDKISAYIIQPLTGQMATTEAPDRFAGAGLGRGEDGTFNTSEGVDSMQAAGYMPALGTLSATENADRARFVAAGVVSTAKSRRVFFVN